MQLSDIDLLASSCSNTHTLQGVEVDMEMEAEWYAVISLTPAGSPPIVASLLAVGFWATVCSP